MRISANVDKKESKLVFNFQLVTTRTDGSTTTLLMIYERGLTFITIDQHKQIRLIANCWEIKLYYL